MTPASNNSMQLEGKTILLGITGGIAAYKSCNIVRLLQKRGARVKVAMSEHATEFVGPLTFRALTNEPVAVGLFDDPSDPIHHISLAQEPDLVVVAPATANIIAKMANGIADDLVLGGTKDGGIRVLIDGDNALRPTDAGEMLDSARDTDAHEELGRDRYTRLANLVAILQPAGLHHGARAAKLGTQSLGKLSHQR